MSSSQPWVQLTAWHWEGLFVQAIVRGTTPSPPSLCRGLGLGSLATGIQPRQRPAIF